MYDQHITNFAVYVCNVFNKSIVKCFCVVIFVKIVKDTSFNFILLA